MSSYLEAYGAAEQHRARILGIVKISSIILGCVAGCRSHPLWRLQESRRGTTRQDLSGFAERAQLSDRLCDVGLHGFTSLPDYPFTKFQEDWGPKSEHADESVARIGLSQSCGSGVLIRLDYKAAEEPVSLWVERDSGTISFAPWPECPGKASAFRSVAEVGVWRRLTQPLPTDTAQR